jgi:iron complex outermembrane receptor protein
LLEFGGNPALKPETAKTWSVGLDFHPVDAPGLRTHVSYYNIRFSSRIANAQAQGVDLTNALALENILGPAIIQRNPSQSLVQALASTPGYADYLGTGINLATIGAIVDSRWHNLSTQNTSGLDFGISYGVQLPAGKIETGLDGTYILKYDNQFTTASPAVSVLNTVYNPVDLKLRARTVFTRDAFSAALFVNYVNAYRDNRSGTSVPVASWTTIDATASYTFAPTLGYLRSTSITFGVINIGNVDPPYVAPEYPGSYGGAAFDGANANVLGRYFSLQVTARY